MTDQFIVKSDDDGYGDMKMFDGKEQYLFPSFVSNYRPKPKKHFEQSAQDKLGYVAIRVHGKDYIVGSAAEKLDSNVQWIGGENKHSDPRFSILYKAGLGISSKSNTEVIDMMTMGLPIIEDEKEWENRVQQLTHLASGKHNFEISYDGKNYQEKSIIVKNVMIKNQPFGSFCDVILNDEGEIRNSDVAKGFNVVIDVGARTMLFLTLDGLEEVPDTTKRFNDGMFTSYYEVADYLKTKHSIVVPDGKLPSIIKDKEVRGMDISAVIEAVYENKANFIRSTFDKLFINSKGFINNVIFTGGGSEKEVLYPYLSQLFREYHPMFLDRFATARGLRKYGIRQMKRQHINPSKLIVRVGNNDYGN